MRRVRSDKLPKEEHDRRQRQHIKAWKEKNPMKVYMGKVAINLRRYGLTPESYTVLYNQQEGRCVICKTFYPLFPMGTKGSTGKLVVDHCHDTGRVRGLLCTACNVGIGMLKDNESLLLNAIEYLRIR